MDRGGGPSQPCICPNLGPGRPPLSSDTPTRLFWMQHLGTALPSLWGPSRLPPTSEVMGTLRHGEKRREKWSSVSQKENS